MPTALSDFPTVQKLIKLYTALLLLGTVVVGIAVVPGFVVGVIGPAASVALLCGGIGVAASGLWGRIYGRRMLARLRAERGERREAPPPMGAPQTRDIARGIAAMERLVRLLTLATILGACLVVVSIVLGVPTRILTPAPAFTLAGLGGFVAVSGVLQRRWAVRVVTRLRADALHNP